MNFLQFQFVFARYYKDILINTKMRKKIQRGSSLIADNFDLENNPTFGEYAFYPNIKEFEELTEESLIEKAQQIFDWAKSKGCEHYSFLCYPHTSGICEKHDSFIDLKYFRDDYSLKGTANSLFNHELLLKGEADGSSFPNGGLRVTHQARAYNIWDSQSYLFIRPSQKVLYIPALLVTHQGYALDDKTLFRECEKVLKKSTVKLLDTLGIKAKSAVLSLGLEQQFFAIPKDGFMKRIDLRSLGRALVGEVPPKNQQFSDHYYGKIPRKIYDMICEVEKELLQIGIPFKTKHNEVAPNQFEFCSIYEEAGKAIDHNMIAMDILKETFDRHGFAALLHEKPFQGINGSGKHANWSLSYINQEGNVKNLFCVPAAEKVQERKIFKLVILLNLMAILRNTKLYLAAIASTGNELRLGGHEAPPRIISVFLGSTISSIIDGQEPAVRKNLRQKMNYLDFDIKQEDTDRNRTSPYAYTGNKFEFRAVGSSQNASFPMAVIAATLAKEMNLAQARLDKGETLDSIIADLTEATRPIRFDGDGYSAAWVEEAKKRGIYVNEEFIENYSNMDQIQDLFVEIGACLPIEISSRSEVLKELYIKTVFTELTTLIEVAHKHVIPNAYNYIAKIKDCHQSEPLQKYYKHFKTLFENVLQEVRSLEEIKAKKDATLVEAGQIRKRIGKVGKSITSVISLLPKDPHFPDIDDFMYL